MLDEDEVAKLFEDVEIEPGTRFNLVFYKEIEGMPVRVEHWTWEHIDALSLILRNEDADKMSDDELKALVDNSTGVTIKRKEYFTFVNFGFRLE